MQSYIYTNNIIVIITFPLMRAVRGNAPNLLAGCNGDQSPPLRIVLSLAHFAGLFCPLRSRVIYVFIRQEHAATVPAKFRPDWPPSLLLSCDRLIRQAEMRQQVLQYEAYTITSGLFHHLQHKSPPATFPSISNSHSHNHTSIYLLVSVL